VTRLIVVARNDKFPSLSHSLPPRAAPPSARNSAPSSAPRFGDGAFVFDATAGRWIVPPPGMTPGAGGAADPRQYPDQTRNGTHVLRFPFSAQRPRPVSPARAVGTPGLVLEVLKMAVGLTVFGLVAGVFLVMS
jgi:hypothetical protein